MKKAKSVLLISSGILLLFAAACTDSGLSVDPAKQKAIIDSTFAARSTVLKDSVSQVCDERMKIEVAARVDSIIQTLETDAEASN